MSTPAPEQTLRPAHYAAIQQALKALPVARQEAMSSRPGPQGPVVDTRATEWQEAKAGLIGARCLPGQDQQVRLRLADGTETVGQLTWAYRWLLQGGRVKWLQAVTHWRPLEPTPAEVAAHNGPQAQHNDCAFRFPGLRELRGGGAGFFQAGSGEQKAGCPSK